LPALTLPFIMAFLKTEQLKIDWCKEWKILMGAGFCYLIPFGSVIGNAISFQHIIMVKTVINNDLTVARVIKYSVYAVFFFINLW
jgi:hypothetical protein